MVTEGLINTERTQRVLTLAKKLLFVFVFYLLVFTQFCFKLKLVAPGIAERKNKSLLIACDTIIGAVKCQKFCSSFPLQKLHR